MHIYETLPLASTGLVMGLVLFLLHFIALLRPTATRALLTQASDAPLAGTVLLGIDFVWVALLLYDAEWNPLCMPLFQFEGFRHILLILCPVLWFILSSMAKENLFPRALGMFLLLMALVPMSAAFLKEPLSRILIPIWWYPVLTAAMFWVAKPYLFRDWMAKLTARPLLLGTINVLGAAYGIAIITCAITLW